MATLVRREILTMIKVYPLKIIAQEIGRLHLAQFIASQDMVGKEQGER